MRPWPVALRCSEWTLATGRETATYSPSRRRSRGAIAGYEMTMRQVEYAARNTRGLARVGPRFVRTAGSAPQGLVEAVRDLARAVRALSAQLDVGAGFETQRLARLAASRAVQVLAERRDLETSEVVGQVRSTAADLVRAAQLGRDAEPISVGSPTEEILASRPNEAG